MLKRTYCSSIGWVLKIAGLCLVDPLKMEGESETPRLVPLGGETRMHR